MVQFASNLFGRTLYDHIDVRIVLVQITRLITFLLFKRGHSWATTTSKLHSETLRQSWFKITYEISFPALELDFKEKKVWRKTCRVWPSVLGRPFDVEGSFTNRVNFWTKHLNAVKFLWLKVFATQTTKHYFTLKKSSQYFLADATWPVTFNLYKRLRLPSSQLKNYRMLQVWKNRFVFKGHVSIYQCKFKRGSYWSIS